MASLLQVLGIGYLLAMVYLTFLYYKRNNYSAQSFIFWIIVWSLGAVLLIFPESLSLLTKQVLKLPRVVDFYLIVGLMFFSIITFLNYTTVKRNEAKVEDLVRKIALKGKKR
jgi:hypothetical protein